MLYKGILVQLTLILFLAQNNLLKAQDFIFKLEGHVYNIPCNGQDSLPLGNVKVRVLGTDGSILESYTDENGYYEFETGHEGERLIQPNTAYTVEVGAMQENASDGCKYLTTSSQESTSGLFESTIFIKDFQLVSANCCCDEMFFPRVIFCIGTELPNLNDYSFSDSISYISQILNENPTITIEIACHSFGSENDDKQISVERAELVSKMLQDSGIVKERLFPIGYGDTKPLISGEEIELMNEVQSKIAIQKNNRCVFRVLSFDYSPD